MLTVIFSVDLVTNTSKFFFNLVKEGDNVLAATADENERQLWVQAIYRATGQTHKPILTVNQNNKAKPGTPRTFGGGGKESYFIVTAFLLFPVTVFNGFIYRFRSRQEAWLGEICIH